ncbi:MAG: cupin domain-containing protein [Candidatus Eremiobacteraeota bacterium]|nr:cupin domain-containing protein [Candidatus Eremiobacteraeota bacterium]
MTIDLGAMTTSDLPTPPPGSRNAPSKALFAADGATGQIQIGTGAKHFHADANEIQYVVSGGGTEWLGDKQIALHPGMLIIIPAGTHHAGYTDPQLKLYAIKTPPQASTDTHYVP